MTDMMRTCMQWMMSLGWVGMLLGFVLIAALVALVIVVILRLGRGSRAT